MEAVPFLWQWAALLGLIGVHGCLSCGRGGCGPGGCGPGGPGGWELVGECPALGLFPLLNRWVSPHHAHVAPGTPNELVAQRIEFPKVSLNV